jgi:hypothetical protein
MNVPKIAIRAALPAALLGTLLSSGPAVWAAGGATTPGVTVSAQNPGEAGALSSLRLTLTAHSEASALESPSCRPQDANLRCWGSLVLRIPDFGGLALSGLEVHRVAVGDTSCGGEEDDGDCGGEMAIPAEQGVYPIEAQVNGLSTITDPGASGLPAGTQVQVKITLSDNGTAQYQDTVDVQVNQFVAGPVKPLVYDTGQQTVQQVQIHEQGR